MKIHKCDKCGMNRTRNNCYYCNLFATRNQ